MNEDSSLPIRDNTSTVDVEYLQAALQVFRLSQGTPSVRDICKSIYSHLEPIAPVSHLFCAEKVDADRIHFLASVNRGEHNSLPDRKLSQDEPLIQALNRATTLSNEEYENSREHWGAELQGSETWILIPMVPSTAQAIGVVGFCSNQLKAFSSTEIDLFSMTVQAVLAVVARVTVINKIISTEREQFMNEASGDVLHDIKNMIGPIPTYVDMIEQESDDLSSSTRKRLQRIKSHAIEIRQNCEGKLLEIKRRIGQPPLTYTDIIELLNSAGTACTTDASEMGGEIYTELALSATSVLVRPQHFFEVLKEIIHNGLYAIRDSKDKRITLRVKRSQTDSNGKFWAVIEIEDTGCGIPKDDLDKIWDLTYSTKPSPGGYGLYRAKSLIESFGGTISVQSEVNSGTKFEIRLPGLRTDHN